MTGSTIYLYSAGSTGPGRGAANLLTATVTTDNSGNFRIAGDYKCASATSQVYLVASGGNPGLPYAANNAALLLMAAIGDCQNLSSASFVNIDEVTTVAAAWALAQFLGPNANVGASSTNLVGLQNAFLQANLLADIEHGTAPGPSLPSTATTESAKLYALANSIATCVNSDGTSACEPLFSAATVGPSIPSTTLDAALAIVQHPGLQVGTIFKLAQPGAPFAGALTRAPNDWTMSITYTGGGLSNPRSVAPDSKGNIWVANFLGGNATQITPAGSVQAFPDASLVESTGVTVDGQDNAWVSNQQSVTINGDGGTVTKFSSTGAVLSGTGFYAGGVFYPYGLAAAPNGSIWVADYGHSAATLLAGNGAALSGANGFPGGASLPFPEAVAVDTLNNAWFGAQQYVVKVTPSGSLSQYTCGESALSLALDASGNLWVSDGAAKSVVELNASGTVLQTVKGVGGIQGTQGIAVDGDGQVWATNYHGSTLSELGPGPVSAALSPPSGYGLDANLNLPLGLTPDASGNLWVANSFLDSVVEFVGLAGPIATPRLGLPAKP